MPANISDQNRIDIIVRLLTDLSPQDKARVMREFSAMGKSGKAAGRQMTEGFEEAQRASTRLADNVIDVHRALQDMARTAGRIGEIGALGAAQVDLAEGFDYLAERAGLNSGKLIASMQKAAKGTVDANAIMRASNMVLGAQFDITTNDMVKMMEFARLKSKQYSLSVEAAFSRMVFGAVKAEVEFLDELGITIRLNDALKIYADQLGVATSKLTSKQRAMAIWKAILADADNQLTEYGGTVTKATDLYKQWEVRILSLTQGVQKFVHKSGLGPFLFLVSKGIQVSLPLLTQYIMLKNMAAASALRHAQALGVENTQLVAQQKSLLGGLAGGAKGLAKGVGVAAKGFLTSAGGAAAIGAGAGVVIYENFTRKLTKTASAGEIATKSIKLTTTALGWFKKAAFEGADAADEWARANLGLRTKAQAAEEAEKVHATLIRGTVLAAKKGEDAFRFYTDAVRDHNTSLREGELAIALLTEKELMLGHVLDTDSAKLRYQAELLEQVAQGAYESTNRYREAAQSLREQADALDNVNKIRLKEAEALSIVTKAIGDNQKKLDELNLALGKTSVEALANRDALDLLARGFEKGTVSAERLTEALKQSATGLIEVTAEERKALKMAEIAEELQKRRTAAFAERATAWRRLTEIKQQIRQSDLQAERDATQEIADLQAQATQGRIQALEAYQAQVAQINRNHARRMEDIEYNHQRRVQDINRNFAKTVRAAAIERNALAILLARETRAEQLGDAERDRQDQVRNEGRNYEDSLAQAQQAYDDQIAELNRHLQEELTRQKQSLEFQLLQNRSYHAAELAELQRHYDDLERITAAHRRRMRALSPFGGGAASGSRGGGGRRGAGRGDLPPGGMQEGGHGVITGPASFYVEPGVREAYWFSGSLAGRGTSPVPGSTTHTMNQNLQIGGNMGVDVRGLGQSLSDKLGPQIAQLVMDSIAEGLGG